MEFAFGPGEERLRSEVRHFLVQQLGASWHNAGPFGHRTDQMFEVAVRFNRALGQKGWLAPAWPREFGGLGASVFEQMVFNEEFGYFGAPDTGTRVFGAGMIGPTLIVHGTTEQQARYLPGINRGDAIWCQGYSEPNAGSDLAALRTTAVRDGDDYVINGQKIWTSGAHYANQMFCLVRTDTEAPKHRGISFLIIDDLSEQEGISIRPLRNMADRHHFNEVFFDNVRVPAQNLVGAENAGWQVAMTLLEFERSGISVTASQRRALEGLVPLARQSAGPPHLPNRRCGLADLFVANGVGRMLGYQIGHLQSRGEQVTRQASAIKVFQSELDQRIGAFSLSLLGLPGLLRAVDRKAPQHGDAIESLIEAVSATIYSGTNEIQRSIIATRGLGLPRD